jgi:nitrogen fixation protein NifB
MSSLHQYPFIHHPCFSKSREGLWARIHLPVAKRCNVKCIFCDHSIGSACHTSKPGYARTLMQPQDAISTTLKEFKRNPQLKIVAISGPGEPLANDATFLTLRGIQEENRDVHFCLSTNGILLETNAHQLKDLGVESISVSMSAIHPYSSAKLYGCSSVEKQFEEKRWQRP